MKPRQYKTKFSRQMVEGLHSSIEVLLQYNMEFASDDDKLHFAVIAQIADTLDKRLRSHILNEYQFTFSAAEAIALRILATDYITDVTTYIGNKLHLISNEVSKQYQ